MSLNPDFLPNEAEYVGAELALRTNFAELVGATSLHDVAVPMYRRRLPDTLETDFRLVPIVGSNPPEHVSRDEAGFGCVLPDGFWAKYQDAETPYIDTYNAIGLGYSADPNAQQKRIIAVASGYVSRGSERPVVRIAQLQGMVSQDEPEAAGLKAGILWRHTLTRAWMHIGRELDMPELVIDAFSSNSWYLATPPAERQRIQHELDRVGADLGFDPDLSPGHWYWPSSEPRAS